MSEQNGYHANIQDSRILQLMGECMEWEVGRYQKGTNAGEFSSAIEALARLKGYIKSAEVELKSMVEGSRKEESVQPLQGVEFQHE